jgi:hypothetical protein
MMDGWGNLEIWHIKLATVLLLYDHIPQSLAYGHVCYAYCIRISVVKLTISVANQILSNPWLHDQRKQNSSQGSTMNFKIYSPKNCHYEKN